MAIKNPSSLADLEGRKWGVEVIPGLQLFPAWTIVVLALVGKKIKAICNRKRLIGYLLPEVLLFCFLNLINLPIDKKRLDIRLKCVKKN